ncbi:MAG TPA: FtsW/RodA/SpoVE family cell cycle protein [Solirubrobacteraceae bacterium]|nr:FtsW/RodA/SpoVE family cell cycle protein [Solirubrobacteraceae bacterium]
MSTTTPIQRTEEPRAPASQYLLRIDPWLLVAAIGLSLSSFVTLRGAGFSSDADHQLLYAGIGLFAALLISRFDYTGLRQFRYVFYASAILLNIVVLGMPAEGPPGGQAHRWIPLPGFSFQSSEFGKVLLIVSLSAFAVDRARRLSERRAVAQVILLALVPAMIVMKQPDLGTALVYVAVAAAVLFFMGTSWKHLAALGLLVVVASTVVLAVAPAVGVNVLKGYEKQRLTTFINPPAVCNSATDQTCYQLDEALIAIGSGEKTGRGSSGATQTRFGYVPEAYADFIFAVIGETYGFAGAAVVLSLYALLIWRTLRILTMAKNLFGTLIAAGVLGMLMFQVFLNIGMAIGIMPVTGVPLPLISYGGSSVLATFLAIGLLQSIHVQARMASAGKARVLLV